LRGESSVTTEFISVEIIRALQTSEETSAKIVALMRPTGASACASSPPSLNYTETAINGTPALGGRLIERGCRHRSWS
ncbi:MAG: hypothetical protein WCC41_21630, partial [Rhodomicrobium sp.]